MCSLYILVFLICSNFILIEKDRKKKEGAKFTCVKYLWVMIGFLLPEKPGCFGGGGKKKSDAKSKGKPDLNQK